MGSLLRDGLSVGVGDSHSAVDFKLSNEVGALTTGSEHHDASPSPGQIVVSGRHG
jgi:hypothetical protein